MTLQYLINTYGYVAIFIGTFLEGEAVLVLGGVAAKMEYLELPWVIVCAFFGTILGDQMVFFLGRYKGEVLLEKWPIWRKRADKVLPILERHRLLIIVGYRFVYGMRSVTPFVLGMARVPIIEFVALNILMAAVWASLIGTLGYAFGHGLELILGDIKNYEIMVLLSIIIVSALLWLRHRLKT